MLLRENSDTRRRERRVNRLWLFNHIIRKMRINLEQSMVEGDQGIEDSSSEENQCQERESRTTHRPGSREKKPAVAAKAKNRDSQRAMIQGCESEQWRDTKTDTYPDAPRNDTSPLKAETGTVKETYG